MSLARRYAAKIAAGIVSVAAATASLALASRVLGPETYGRFEFLKSFFLQLTAFLDTGTSTAFFTKLSQRPGDRGLVRFYARFVVFVSVLMLAGTALVAASPLGIGLWAGEPVEFILLGAALGCVTWWHQVARKAVDAHALTVRGELLDVANKAGTTLALVLIVLGGWLTLGLYFAIQIAGLAAGIALWVWLVRKKQEVPAGADKRTTRNHVKEFWDYSHPMFVYALVGTLLGVFERWLLQTQAGAAQQGFFGLAAQVGAICFLFTSAMTQLLTREFAIAWESADRSRMAVMFSRNIPLFYSLAAYFSVFIAFHAGDVVWLVGGEGFAEGASALALMALYPLHQTYGQLSGSVFLATGQTRLYRNIGIYGLIAGLPLVYWLVAPAAHGGLGLGAVGLAIKILLLQLVLVNIQLWFNVRLLSLRFGWFVLHQLAVPLAMTACSWAASATTDFLDMPRLWKFLFSGVIYSSLALAIVLIHPRMLGVERRELAEWWNNLVRREPARTS